MASNEHPSRSPSSNQLQGSGAAWPIDQAGKQAIKQPTTQPLDLEGCKKLGIADPIVMVVVKRAEQSLRIGTRMRPDDALYGNTLWGAQHKAS